MSAPGASPDLQDLSQYSINFLVRDVDIEFAAFLEAQAVCARAFSALKEHCNSRPPAADDAAPVDYMQIDQQNTAE